MDKLKAKIALYKTILGITVGGAVYSGLLNHDYNTNVEHIVEIPSSVRYRLYLQGELDKELLGDYYPGQSRIDDLCTYEVLEKVNHMVFDLEIEKDLSIINKMPNLSSLTVFYAENLTKDQIELINSSSASRITLYFTNPCLHKEDKLDLSLFKNKEEVTINFYPLDELQAVTMFNYLENMDQPNTTINFFGDHSDNILINKLDHKLDDIIKEIGISNKDDEKTKLYKIVNYTNNKIEYDKSISQYLSDEEGSVEEYIKLSQYYNNYDLSCILLNEESEVPGVCINYANLFDILCYKCGIKSRTIDGTTDKVAHAWNVLYLDENKYYVDLTSADCTYINDKLEEFINSTDNNTRKELAKKIDCILLQSLNTHKAYRLNTPINNLDSNNNFKDVYYNVGLDGKPILHKEIPEKKYALIGLSCGILLIATLEVLKRLKKHLYDSYLTEEEYDNYPEIELIDLDKYDFNESNEQECKIYSYDEYKKKKNKGGK